MKTTSIRARALACALLAGTAFCGLTAAPAAAQTAREHRALDANGVDLTHGDFVMAFTEGSIGSGDAELALVRTGVFTPAANNGHSWDSLILVQNSSSGLVNNDVYLGSTLVPFHNSETSPDGSATLTGGGSGYTYQSADGTQIQFGDPTNNSEPGSNLCNGSEGQTNCSLLPLAITAPDGKAVTIEWDTSSYCPFNSTCTYYTRIAAVSNSFGYRIAFDYAGGLNSNGIPTSGWFKRTGARFYNDAVSTTTVQASTGYAYPSTGVTEVTDTGGRVWRFAGSMNGITAIRRPGATSDTTTVAYSTGSSVSSVTNEGVTTTYSRSISGSTATMTATQIDPNGPDPVTTIVSDLGIGRPTAVTDPLSHTTAYQYDSAGRLTRVTAPEGNYVQYTYDARGNVTQTQRVGKGGSGTITTSASYDLTCANPVTCNSPNSVTDARGNTTDYTYDPNHGGVLTATGPAPAPNAVRPQTRYSYTLINGEYRLTGTSACRTGAPALGGSPAACLGTADEVKTAITYDATGNVASTTSGSGDGALTATTSLTHDAVGNLVIVDGPLTDVDDRSDLRYNGARQVVGTISPDPDGTGPLKPRAVRNVYANGLLGRVEPGNVDNQSSDLATFVAATDAPAVETDYENARPVATRVIGGTTVYALTQTSYDGLGRVDCSVQRMNMADFGSTLPGACTMTSTANGRTADRIVRRTYDLAGRVTKVTSAYGVSGEQADDVTTSYTDNGVVQSVTDAENNKTSYVYDAFDRLSQTWYPSATKGAGTSNSSDLDQVAYDAGGNVTSFTNRAAETIGFTYDALGRMTLKNLPGSELDVTYAYDLLGQMTSAGTSAQTLAFTYDALGRQLSQADGSRTYSSAYDLAGRRTRITHPDGFFVDQDYLVTGEMTAIKENGSFVLADFGYDQLGRRERLTLGNGDVTRYGYDDASRLHTLEHDLAGTANDNIVTFAYNPAGQITGRTATNEAYAWTGHGNGTTTYATDGLNRLTSQTTGPTVTAFNHDARGDRLNDDIRSYGYDSETKGRGAPAAPWHYDPLGRLSGASTSPTAPPAIAYESYVDNLVAERTPGSSTVQRRHVFGPGSDEPLVWYEGSSRRFLHADERGSIVAITSDAGALLAINRYDEYGRTETTNATYTGRFGYTGQRYFGGFGLYHYKNRLYDPRTGRFMQPDPIGYGAGMNRYAYVGGDPVNSSDPTGLCTDENGDFYEPAGTRICDQKPAPNGVAGGGTGSGGSGNGGGGRNDPTNNAPVDLRKPIQLADATDIFIRGIQTVMTDAPVVQGWGFGVLLLPFLLGGDTCQKCTQNIYYHYGYASDAHSLANGLYPGSFATTVNYYTGAQARAFLALPSVDRYGNQRPVPDSYYVVKVDSQTRVIGPTPVRPEYGQPGGGTQVQFPNGTPPGSVKGPVRIRGN